MVLEFLTFCVYVYAQMISCIQLFVTPLRPRGLQPTKVPLSMGFSRQDQWSGLPFPTPGDLLTQELNTHLLIPQATAHGGCKSRTT